MLVVVDGAARLATELENLNLFTEYMYGKHLELYALRRSLKREPRIGSYVLEHTESIALGDGVKLQRFPLADGIPVRSRIPFMN